MCLARTVPANMSLENLKARSISKPKLISENLSFLPGELAEEVKTVQPLFYRFKICFVSTTFEANSPIIHIKLDELTRAVYQLIGSRRIKPFEHAESLFVLFVLFVLPGIRNTTTHAHSLDRCVDATQCPCFHSLLGA